LPLLVEAMNECHQFLTLIQATHLSPEKDQWIVTTPGYKVCSIYKSLMRQGPVIPAMSWL
jgi:hypothetical protein